MPYRLLAGKEKEALVMDIPSGYFVNRYGPLKGRDWLRSLPREEMLAFAHVGFAASGYGKKGGIVRSRTAKRDDRGRFI